MKYFSLILFTFLLMVSCGGESSVEGSAELDGTFEASDSLIADSLNFPLALSFDAFCAMFDEYPAEVESLDSLFELYEFNKEGYSQLERDSACMLYVGHMHQIANSVEGEDMGTQYEDMKAKYEPYGFTVGGGEGYLWLIVNSDAAGKRFEGDISKDAREYMRLGEVTGKQYSADAGMLISYDEWADVVIDLEERVIANQDSPYLNHFIYTYQSFLANFLYGMDNTPTVWYGEQKFDDEVQAAYDKVWNDSEHKTALFIEEHYGRMEESNYQWDWESRWVPTVELIKDIFELKK